MVTLFADAMQRRDDRMHHDLWIVRLEVLAVDDDVDLPPLLSTFGSTEVSFDVDEVYFGRNEVYLGRGEVYFG